MGQSMLTEDVVSPYGAQVFGFGDGHGCDANVADSGSSERKKAEEV